MLINSPLVKRRPATAGSTGAQARAGVLTQGAERPQGQTRPEATGMQPPEFSGQGSEGMQREPGSGALRLPCEHQGRTQQETWSRAPVPFAWRREIPRALANAANAAKTASRSD